LFPSAETTAVESIRDPSILPESHDGVDGGGAPGGDAAGEQRDHHHRVITLGRSHETAEMLSPAMPIGSAVRADDAGGEFCGIEGDAGRTGFLHVCRRCRMSAPSNDSWIISANSEGG
jgi:hypothetical protein